MPASNRAKPTVVQGCFGVEIRMAMLSIVIGRDMAKPSELKGKGSKGRHLATL